MRITINNDEAEFSDPLTVRQLLDSLGLAGQYVAVERNRAIVPHRTFDDTVLADGDVLEVVTLVGGG